MISKRTTNKRKRSKPSSGTREQPLDLPSKKRKISVVPQTLSQPSINGNIRNKSPHPSYTSQNHTQTPSKHALIASNIGENDTESTPTTNDEMSPVANTKQTSINNTDLGHLMSGTKPGFFTKKEVIIHQLHKMAETGSIPTSLREQMEEYYRRKKQKHISTSNHHKNTNQNRSNASPSVPICNTKPVTSLSHKSRVIPSPDHQPIVIEEQDAFDVEEDWNCNVFLCCLVAVVFVICICVLNIRFGAHNMVYCDHTHQDPTNTTCVRCPQNAKCTKGAAYCMDAYWKLHPFKGCLNKDAYNKRINTERLYAKVHELLKQNRRKFVLCDDSVEYEWKRELIEDYFIRNIRNIGMDKMELEEALKELFLLMDEVNYINEIEQNEKGEYYAVLPQWELDASSSSCVKLNVLLMAKTYGLELSLSVVCVAVLLVSWRNLLMMFITICGC